jgi:hypothetical protein
MFSTPDGGYYKRVRLPSIYPELISRGNLLAPDDIADGGGTTVPLSGGSLVCSAAVLCGGMRHLPEHTSTGQRLGPR